mgnify:CR=1 FL=1
MDNLMYLIVMWIAAILFIIIGIYAMNRKNRCGFGPLPQFLNRTSMT